MKHDPIVFIKHVIESLEFVKNMLKKWKNLNF